MDRKDRFSALDTLAFARELRHHLGGARLDKVFDLPGDGVAVSWRRAGSDRRELRLYPGRYGALAPSEGARIDEPGPLARELRRWITGSLVASIPDPQGERIIELELRRGDAEPLTLAVEFFSPGNLVVVRSGRLVVVARPRTWAHRSVRVGQEYVRPPLRIDPWRASVAELEAALAGSRADRVSTLAVRLALGGPLAEEVLARSGLSGSEPGAENVAAVAPAVHRSIQTVLAEVGDVPHGFLFLRSESVEDVEPFRAHRWRPEEGTSVTELPTFSEAVERYFGPRAVGTPKEAPVRSPSEELERQRSRQAEAVARLAREYEAFMAEAERLFAHYSEAEAALSRILAAGPAPGESVRIELDGAPTRVWPDRSVRESAQTIYAEAKRAQQKLAGATAALEDTERRLEEIAVKAPTLPQPTREPTSPPARRLWFERFRWFISSEGVVVVAGRDASSNDLVVRRYLKESDLYVHADLHGAPSVVVKHPEAGRGSIGEMTLHEAGRFGVAFSKAWRAGMAAADAFWVNADQVSKSATSGEFVARGAWVIHGTKHFLKDLPLEMALGEVEVYGVRRWVVAAPEAVRRWGTIRVLLGPGEERDRPSVERELASSLGVGRSLLQALLPAGGVVTRRA